MVSKRIYLCDRARSLTCWDYSPYDAAAIRADVASLPNLEDRVAVLDALASRLGDELMTLRRLVEDEVPYDD